MIFDLRLLSKPFSILRTKAPKISFSGCALIGGGGVEPYSYKWNVLTGFKEQFSCSPFSNTRFVSNSLSFYSYCPGKSCVSFWKEGPSPSLFHSFELPLDSAVCNESVLFSVHKVFSFFFFLRIL